MSLAVWLGAVRKCSAAVVGLDLVLGLSMVPGGGGVLPYKRLMGMCRWMGSHFHDWSDYNRVAFSIELLEWGRNFSAVWGK